MTLDEARQMVGNKVVYRAPFEPNVPQEGVITSVNDSWVFVRYGSQAGSQATSPWDLEPVGAGRV